MIRQRAPQCGRPAKWGVYRYQRPGCMPDLRNDDIIQGVGLLFALKHAKAGHFDFASVQPADCIPELFQPRGSVKTDKEHGRTLRLNVLGRTAIQIPRNQPKLLQRRFQVFDDLLRDDVRRGEVVGFG